MCMVSVPCQLHHTGSASDSGYPGHILGIPTDLEHQLRDFPVFVFKGKLGAFSLRRVVPTNEVHIVRRGLRRDRFLLYHM